MAHRLEPTSDMQRRVHATSYPGEQHLELVVAASPPEVFTTLPENYGAALFQILVVDTRYVFVSWEIPPEQMSAALAELQAGEPADFKVTMLVRSDTASGQVVASFALYGELGRSFLYLGQAGSVAFAELGVQSKGRFVRLNAAGPLDIPREKVVEPTEYSELRVTYGLGPDGELVLLGAKRRAKAPWPDISLPAPAYDELLPRPLPAVPVSSPMGAPSSSSPRGHAWSSLPSSHVIPVLPDTVTDEDGND